jgi:ribonuclease BN (tRNA processing enzyme)
MLLAEASFLSRADNPTKLHLTGYECGETATRGGVPRLVLTHVPPWHDKQRVLGDARTTFTGPVELAATGSSYFL